MSYTKRQFITAAFTEIGLSSYAFDAEPQAFEEALKRLDSMIADWAIKGLRVGFPLASSPEFSELDAETGCPMHANEAVITNLAIKIAPSYGKMLARETKVAAKDSLNNLYRYAGVTSPVQKAFPSTMPKGAGHKSWRQNQNPFFVKEADIPAAGSDGPLDLF